MGPGEGLELLKSEPGSRLGSGKSADKLQTDRQIQSGEYIGGVGIVAPQDVAQAVVGLDDRTGQELFQADQSCDLLGEQAVGMPEVQAGTISAQHVRNQVSIGAIRIGSAGPKASTEPPGVIREGHHRPVDVF
jgi:hypothetical protein